MTGMENVPVTSDQGRVYDLIISADINHSNWDNHQWPMQCSRVTVCHHYSGDRDAGPEMGHWECVHITQCQGPCFQYYATQNVNH